MGIYGGPLPFQYKIGTYYINYVMCNRIGRGLEEREEVRGWFREGLRDRGDLCLNFSFT